MLTWIIALLVAILVFLIFKKKWVEIFLKTYKRDLIGAYRFIKFNYILRKWDKNQQTVAKVFTRLVRKHPHRIIYHFENEAWTYRQLDEFSNKVANYFKQNYKKGESVSLLLENRPEYIGIWLGLSKIGVVTALINTNLTSDPLIHCLKTSNSTALIYSHTFSNVIKSIRDKIPDTKLFQFNEATIDASLLEDSLDLMEELSKMPTDFTKEELAVCKPRDPLVYIYTSGTTGLPKAAVVTNMRYMLTTTGCNTMTNLNKDDIFYSPLPLYHSSGGMVGAGQGLLFGITVVLKRKFSASNFWIDCNKYKCTVANYIGEICRYLLAVHKPDSPKNLTVKKMSGNGLRPQIWQQFVDTFNIEQIYEFYGSTEGNTNLINIDNKLGAVGFVPRYAYALYPLTIIKCDEQTGEPIRNASGFCSKVDVDEAGILLGKITLKHKLNEFSGYADKAATEKKILKDVLVKGDMYFNTGDILVQDELGYFYFRDRTGDTFRWKGENVASTEVESAISNIVDLKDSVVFGVEIPGTEGKAGMMAIVDPENQLDKEKLAQGLKSRLPPYAIPLFMRIIDKVELTGTFKLKKTDLQKEGYNLDVVKDQLYFYDGKNTTYIPLTKEIHDGIINGKIKV